MWKMEGINSDSEGHYAQEDLQGTPGNCTPIQNQLQTATSNAVPASRTGTCTEDLSRAPSEDRSPMLTPNTAQDWINEDNLECMSHRDETVPPENATRGCKLDNKQDTICWNAQNVRQDAEMVAEDTSLERSEQSLCIEHHPQGILNGG
jgi:hypothetical protein